MPRTLLLAVMAAAIATGPSHAADASLFEQLGGMPGIERIVGGMVDRAVADPRIAFAFDNTNHDRLKRLIAQQFCHLAGGPCAARERGMGPAHRHLDLAERHFNALVGDLQDSMDAAGTPFRAQLNLCALGAAAQQVATVAQKGRVFSPKEIAVNRGDTVVFVNDDGELLHHVHSDDPRQTFDTGEQPAGARSPVRFAAPGVFDVRCRIHPRMLVRVTVR